MKLTQKLLTVGLHKTFAINQHLIKAWELRLLDGQNVAVSVSMVSFFQLCLCLILLLSSYARLSFQFLVLDTLIISLHFFRKIETPNIHLRQILFIFQQESPSIQWISRSILKQNARRHTSILCESWDVTKPISQILFPTPILR